MGGKQTSPRPYEINNPSLYTRVDPETKQEVIDYANRNGVSIAEAIRQLVEFGLEDDRAASSGTRSEIRGLRNARADYMGPKAGDA